MNSRKNLPAIIFSTQLNTAKSYVEEKFHGARGHGFAAERANNLCDNFTGNDAKIIGDNNLKNGADRLVNGVQIQSKYCSSGAKCIQECFDGGKFRYYNPDGSPMQIEVPADKYSDAVKAMQNRIDSGQIRGVKNAEDVVRKGNFTYEQAKNIAWAGTVESLTYDAVDGVKIAGYAGGISAILTFAFSTWNGKNFEDALKDSVKSGLSVGGVAWASSILVGQMTKAGANSLLVSPSNAVVNMIGPKAAAQFVNFFREGGNIYGAAAMSNAAKLLRGNVVTGIATTLVLSAGDVINIFRGRISAKQLVKNVVNTGAGVAGGIGGAAYGAAIGSVVPVVGTFIGGMIGGFLAGNAASKISKAVTDEIIDDDSQKMFKILESEFQNVATDYLLNKPESEQVADILQKKLDSDTIKDMYAASDRHSFTREFIVDCAESVVNKRQKIYLPTNENYLRGLRNVLEQ